jgi:hypothetical protein
MAALVLTGPREWFWWWSGSHPQARSAHAMAALMWWSAERAAEQGCVRLNLGGSAGQSSVASFKAAMGARDLPVTIRWMGPAHAGVFGRVLGAVQARLRAGRERGEPR